MGLNRMKLAVKLPLLFVCFSIVVASVIAAIAYLNFRQTLLSTNEAVFVDVADDRRSKLQDWLDSVAQELTLTAKNPSTSQAAAEFTREWRSFPGDAQAAFQKSYIEDNPNPVGEKHLMFKPVQNLFRQYDFLHENYHGFFTELMENGGYYDVFILSPDGDLVYSVFKEWDYGTNFVDGEFAESGLGRAFRSAVDAEQGQLFFEDFTPYGPSADAPAAFFSTPIVNSFGGTEGVLAIQLPISRINEIVNYPGGLGEQGIVTIVGADGRTRNDARIESLYEVYSEVPMVGHVQRAIEGGEEVNDTELGMKGTTVLSVTRQVDIFGTRWTLMAEKPLSEILRGANETGRTIALVLAVSVIFVTILGLWVARSIVAPIGRISAIMSDIASGKFDTEVIDSNRQDELGDIARVVSSTQAQLEEAREAERIKAEAHQAQNDAFGEVRAIVSKLAAGDFTDRLAAELPAEFTGLRDDLNDALISLQTTLNGVKEVVVSINNSAQEFSEASDSLAHRTEKQASALDESSLQLNEMTQTVASGATNAQSAMEFVEKAVTEAQDSRVVVTDATSAMSRILDASERISTIVDVMDDIAFQTNLLALNAGVEAARAGESGRGFAVVASEVRALAKRSSEASNEIKQLIEQSEVTVREGSTLVSATGTALTSIAQRVEHITQLVREIAQGSESQSQSITGINSQIKGLGGVTQQNAAMVEEFNASSQLLKDDAGRLSMLVNDFKTEKAAHDSDHDVMWDEEHQDSSVKGQDAGGSNPASEASHDDWEDWDDDAKIAS